jgi:hypothetical protein
MSYKSKNDINYFKFLELTARIVDETDSRHVLEEAFLVFQPKRINDFARALEVDGKLIRRFELDIDFEKVGGAGRFIDADTMHGDSNILGLFKVILKPKRRFIFWRYDIERDLSLREAADVLEKWLAFLSDIKKIYEYIYNPPLRINAGGSEMTQGSFERQAFAEMYGGYMEITYLLTNGQAVDEELVWSWGLNRFLFRGEYSLRKRDVENIK